MTARILLGELTYREQAFLDAAGEFLLYGNLYVVSRYLFILDEGLPQLLVAARYQDRIELRFVRAPLFLA